MAFYSITCYLCYYCLAGVAIMKNADRIRLHGKERYVAPARGRKQKRFSIRAGDVVQELKLAGHTPAVCSALKTEEFLRENNLRLVGKSGPPSGQSTTVVYTYEFIDPSEQVPIPDDPWLKLRGIGKDIFAALGGGEAFIRQERASFNREDRDSEDKAANP
jgi:hypothetical protein